MARRESQGLQITLIVFVMLTIILAVTTIAFWNRSKTLSESNLALQTENSAALNGQNTAMDESARMKVWLGQTADASIETIEEQYNRDMSTYATSAPEVQRTYKDVPALLFAALQQRNKQVTDLRQQQKDAQTEFDQTRQQLSQERDEARRIQAETEAELRKTRDEFAKNRDKLNADRDRQVAEIQKLQGELASLQAKTAQQLQEMDRELNFRQSIISQRDGQLSELTTESFETPDGKVVSVIPRAGTAYINLGAEDGLRRQVTFSVYGADTNGLAHGDRKGSLEVTRIVNDHMSEVRITDDGLGDPILTGDVIYTPLWNSRSALHFALAGTMDINGDGKDDREIIKQLIRINNGTIDAEEAKGDIDGEITRHTRYLVVGDPPEVGDADDSDASARQKAWSRMIEQANQLGVEQLSVEKLVDFVGYDGQKRTLPLGEDARADDFLPRGDGTVTRGSVFRERQPRPRRGGF